jgi:hypothetical protein
MPGALILLAVLFRPGTLPEAKVSVMPDIATCEQYAEMLHTQIESIEPSMGELQTFCVDVHPSDRPALRELERRPT